MPTRLHPGFLSASRHALLSLGRLGCALLGTLALAAHAGQSSASITVSVTLTPAPVTVVSGGSTVVVCGTVPVTGDTNCGAIIVPTPPATSPGGGGNVPIITPPISTPPVVTPPGTGNASGGGSNVPVVPTPPVNLPIVPPVQIPSGPSAVVPDPGTGDSGSVPPSVTLPAARATLELLNLLQARLDPVTQGSNREPIALSSAARLESWRVQSTQVFSSASATRLSNLLGTSAEVRIVREVALNYTEMLIGW